ncbi:MAG: hypothetical protein ACK4Q5_16595 [Saprospiraceae bacterium]
MNKQDLHEYDPNFLAYDEWLVEENEAGNRVAAFTRVECRITEDWRAEWQEEFCEADLLDGDELLELELAYHHDQHVRAAQRYRALVQGQVQVPEPARALHMKECFEHGVERDRLRAVLDLRESAASIF